MEQSRGLAGHRVLEITKLGQRGGDEGVEAGQGLGAVERPAQVRGLGAAEAGHACGLQHVPQGAVVVPGAPVGGFGRRAGPGLAVVRVVIPLPAFGRAAGVQQQMMAAAHVAVEVLHQPLLAPAHQRRQFIAGAQKVLAVDGFAVQGPGLDLGRGPLLQLGVEAPFIGLLPLHGLGTIEPGECGEVVGNRLAVAGVVQGHIAHAVARGAQLPRKIAHRGKDGQDLLCVVQHIVGLLAHFHQHIDHLRVHLAQPAVPGVELVAQHQAQRLCRRAHRVLSASGTFCAGSW